MFNISPAGEETPAFENRYTRQPQRFSRSLHTMASPVHGVAFAIPTASSMKA